MEHIVVDFNDITRDVAASELEETHTTGTETLDDTVSEITDFDSEEFVQPLEKF